MAFIYSVSGQLVLRYTCQTDRKDFKNSERKGKQTLQYAVFRRAVLRNQKSV